MTETFYSSKVFKTDHSTYGGNIYPSDFDRKVTLSEIAARIESDKKFDQACRKFQENKMRGEKQNGGNY